ncbi:MAG: diphthine--ammonia ligase [Candidatus Diapherotrites archaeon]
MIGVLFSGGKDSVFTLFHYMSKDENIGCLITMKSENKASWMFHTPAINMVELQAEALGLPLLIHSTKGEKEKELEDLEIAIKKAKEKYNLTGIGAGALFSQYQYDRVKRICDSLGLDCFAPHWHKNQAEYLREILDAGFEVIITGIASQGLSKEFLGEKIDDEVFDKFLELNKKIGFHVAGEGGEYESLVVDGPIFKKKLKLVETKKVMQNEMTGHLEIIKAELVDK